MRDYEGQWIVNGRGVGGVRWCRWGVDDEAPRRVNYSWVLFLSAQFALNSPKFIIHLLPRWHTGCGLRPAVSVSTCCLGVSVWLPPFAPRPLHPHLLSGRVILNAWACCSETGLAATLSLQLKNTSHPVEERVSPLLHYSLFPPQLFPHTFHCNNLPLGIKEVFLIQINVEEK